MWQNLVQFSICLRWDLVWIAAHRHSGKFPTKRSKSKWSEQIVALSARARLVFLWQRFLLFCSIAFTPRTILLIMEKPFIFQNNWVWTFLSFAAKETAKGVRHNALPYISFSYLVAFCFACVSISFKSFFHFIYELFLLFGSSFSLRAPVPSVCESSLASISSKFAQARYSNATFENISQITNTQIGWERESEKRHNSDLCKRLIMPARRYKWTRQSNKTGRERALDSQQKEKQSHNFERKF